MKYKSYYLKITLSILLIIIISISVTYAYFQVKLSGIESVSTISVGGSQLEIKYVGSNEIIADKIMPGWSDTKYFNVELKNNTGKSLNYDINIEVVDSNFYTEVLNDKGYMQYVLKKCESESSESCTEILEDAKIIDVQSGTKKVRTIFTVDTSGITYYALDFVYPDTNFAQSQKGTDGELVHFSGYVTINSTSNTIKDPVDFATDSWPTIANYVSEYKEETNTLYPVGAEKEVALEGFTNGEAGSNGLYTVRIANNSNYDCDLDSKTACGFVVEFVDIITTYIMNPAGTYNGIEYPNGTNVGGWPGSAMYKYLNGDTSNHMTYDSTNATIYSKLPSDLQNVIIDTYAVSGHGTDDTGTRRDENWESTDKLYLLAAGEIYSDCLTSNCYDTASYPFNGSGGITTRQLDYYNGFTTDNYSGVIKQNNGSNLWWWLRGGSAGAARNFAFVGKDGIISYSVSFSFGGVAPAFRIG